MITQAQIEAIAMADAYLNNANLPTYKELAYQFDLLIKGVDSWLKIPSDMQRTQALSDCIDASEELLKATKTI